MDDIYLLWIRESLNRWIIFGYTTDGQAAISWKEKAENGVQRMYERVNYKDI